MTIITKVHAREVLDSRGNPTIEVELSSARFTVSAIVPSGASTGIHEALELRDGNKNRYGGKGVLKAVSNANSELATLAIGRDCTDQKGLDAAMILLDGTPNKSRLGANAILGISMAAAKLAAAETGKPLWQRFRAISIVQGFTPSAPKLPRPMMNVINGGAHADSGLSIQEFMIVPVADLPFAERLRIGAEVFHALKKRLSAAGQVTAVGDEGGFAPHFSSNEEAIEVILAAASDAGHHDAIAIALDCAASEFFRDGAYELQGVRKSSDEMIEFYAELCEKYPIVSIEDGLAEDDWAGWARLTQRLGDRIQLVGDDLFVTNPERIARGIAEKSANSVLIKLNQIGTITETIAAVAAANTAGWTAVISHRSGESEDTTIADLAVGLSTGQIKTGSLSRTDRIAKYNQLLRIEESIGA